MKLTEAFTIYATASGKGLKTSPPDSSKQKQLFIQSCCHQVLYKKVSKMYTSSEIENYFSPTILMNFAMEVWKSSTT